MDEMNEVHEFMSKFDPYVETKFGLGTDEELGKKVKITILATGFGLSDVLSDVGSGSGPREGQLDEETEERMRERRKQFYSDEEGASKRHYNCFHFKSNDLDNDEVISMVESTPTYKRDSTTLKQIKAISLNMIQTKEAENPKQEEAADENVIVFK